ncbi:hypothetical protein IE4803_CH03405 [Rhizobium etli bv. phaseoli str. IE4803]|nr:hypothetical protein IE4803_CH03405 [Rhizobium etli bv. phaseoli str. IE4803]
MVHGLAITARCDMAQKKYGLLNYVPIVELDDWLRVDGLEMLIADESRDLKGRVESALRDSGLATSLTLAIPLRGIASVHFSSEAGDRRSRERAEKFFALVDLIEQFQASIAAGPDETFTWFKRHRLKKVVELIRKLSKHDVTGFYFLERLEEPAPPSGYVCLLREVTTIPQTIAEELANGLTKAAWKERYEHDGKGCLKFDPADFGMPISQLASPTIEHLMQCFSNLFGRIGLPDPLEDEISSIITASTQLEEAH